MFGPRSVAACVSVALYRVDDVRQCSNRLTNKLQRCLASDDCDIRRKVVRRSGGAKCCRDERW